MGCIVQKIRSSKEGQCSAFLLLGLSQIICVAISENMNQAHRLL